MSCFGNRIATCLNALAIGLCFGAFVLGMVNSWPRKPISTWEVHNVNAIGLSSTGAILFAGDNSGLITAHDADSGQVLTRWPSSETAVTSLALSPDDSVLAVGHGDGTVKCWNVSTCKLLLEIAHGEVGHLQFSPDGRMLAVASYQGRVQIIRHLNDVIELSSVSTPVRAIQFSEDSRFLAVASDEVTVWNLEDQSIQSQWPVSRFAVVAMKYSSTSSELNTVSFAAEVETRRTVDGELIQNMNRQYRYLRDASFVFDSRAIAAAHGRGGLKLLDLMNGAQLQSLQEQGSEIIALSSSRNGRSLAIIDKGNRIKVWRPLNNMDDVESSFAALIANRQFQSRLVTILFIISVGVTLAASFWDWRPSFLACLFFETIRDPVRKFLVDESILLPLTVSVAWICIAIVATHGKKHLLVAFLKKRPELCIATVLLVLAILPGFMISLVRFSGGWILALGGATMYLLPVLGVLFGSVCAVDSRFLKQWLTFYGLLCAFGAASAILEFAACNIPGLGGIRYIWYRSFLEGQSYLWLSCGIYRSPDALGLHSALGLMFLIFVQSPAPIARRIRYIPGLLLLFAGLSLSGRRKMLALPVIFVVIFVSLLLVKRGRRQTAVPALVTIALGMVAIFAVGSLGPHGLYYQSLAWASLPRIQDAFTNVFESWQQQGLWGAGLGTVTQGLSQFVSHGVHNWQEDGLSRAMVELGIPGMILAFASLGFVCWSAIRSLRGRTDSSLTIGMLSITGASLAGFMVSHQVYSGDPCQILMASICLGVALSGPEVSDLPDQTTQQQEGGHC